MSQNGRPVVLIADKLAQSTVDALGDAVEVRWVDGPNRPELLDAVKEADALLVRSATTVDAEVIAAAPNLKIVGRAGVGLDNVDIPAATEAGVMVANAPTSNIHSACEHAISLLLSTARQIPAADATLREGEWKRSSFNGVEIFGKLSVSSVLATLVSCLLSVLLRLRPPLLLTILTLTLLVRLS